MIVKLLTEHNLEFLSLKGGCRASSESTLVKMSNCWKSHITTINFESFEQALHVLVHMYLSPRRPASARMKVDEGS